MGNLHRLTHKQIGKYTNRLLLFISMLTICMVIAYSAQPWQNGVARLACVFANYPSSLSTTSCFISSSLHSTRDFYRLEPSACIAGTQYALGLASNNSNIVFVLGSMSTESSQSVQGLAAEAFAILPQTPQFAFTLHRFSKRRTSSSVDLEARYGAKALSTTIERELGRV